MPFAASVPPLKSVCTARAIRFCIAVIDPALTNVPACPLTSPLLAINPFSALLSRPVVVSVTLLLFSAVMRPLPFSRLAADARNAPPDCNVPLQFDSAPLTLAFNAPLVAIVPFTFDNEPVLIDSVPVPESVILPPSLISAAGAMLRSRALVAIVPLALSSVPVTASVVVSVPVCVSVPLWLTRSVAATFS
ncbi:hypothetical protein AWB82_07135 [Caballeronia glebae]|uniref:Uncharacterized protein n=1 Tax=Caballeronia glebae TaxID=1777143 RepID=A0A158DS66_9BURK|nr:hypothetical protein AWB82_07135 [Caballeronia glebae]